MTVLHIILSTAKGDLDHFQFPPITKDAAVNILYVYFTEHVSVGSIPESAIAGS